jgi:acetoacetyl-CoA synthetase
MTTIQPGSLLSPAPAKAEWADSRVGRYLLGIEQRHGRTFDTYEDAWRWSVEDLDGFWESIVDEFEIIEHTPHTAVLADATMPGAQWFPGATLNYAEHIVRALRARPDRIMVHSRSQTAGSVDWTGARLLDEIGRIQRGLAGLGIGEGDRVAGYLPNIPQTLAAYIAATALGAVWCSVPPEMGSTAVVQRIGQLDPTLVIAVDGYRWGAKDISRVDDLAEIRTALPDARVVLLPYLDVAAPTPDGVIAYADFTARAGAVELAPVPFAHPLVVLFSSGTTGRPKAIVHCHGGFLLEHYKSVALHYDLDDRDTVFYYTTTGWMVWNMMVSSLLVGAAVVLVDGDPAWPALDGPWAQWAIVEDTGATFLGTAAAYLATWAHSGLRPADLWDMGRLREIVSSGSPLAADVAAWLQDAVNPEVFVAPTSGGTDVCTALVGGCPLVAVYAGEMSCRPLGVDVEALDPQGRPVVGSAGELVVRRPMPSMPVFFWGDEGFERYTASYFDMYKGQWRHGDWLIRTERDSWVITGRSDATLNRGGVRIGTAEYYEVLDGIGEVADSMVVHFEDGTGMGELVLALTLTPDSTADTEALEAQVRIAVRSRLSPRHSPDHVVIVPSVPRNKTGKRLEVPLKRIIKGEKLSDVIDIGVVVEPDTLTETAQRISHVLRTVSA